MYPTPSDDAVETWRDFARTRGVSYTAIIEALADELRRYEKTPTARLPVMWRQVLERAVAHDAENRRRD